MPGLTHILRHDPGPVSHGCYRCLLRQPPYVEVLDQTASWLAERLG